MHGFFAVFGKLLSGFAYIHMTSISFSHSTTGSRGGGRIASPAFRHSLQQCADFTGLEETTNRYDLLLLVKRVGKAAGFTSRMMQLLDYYMAFTRECDWEEGARPIVYQSLARTALDLGVTERQIQKIEKQLFEVGAITWNDSGNHKRYGQRDPKTGRLLYAYGVDLTPLAYLRGELQEKLHEKQLRDSAWLEAKRQISAARRQIRSMLLEWEQEEGRTPELQAFTNAYEAIAVQIRTHIALPALRSMLQEHHALHDKILGHLSAAKPAAMEAQQVPQSVSIPTERTSTSDLLDAHYKYTTLKINKDSSPTDASLQESVADPSVPFDPVLSAGVPHVTLKAALQAASPRLRERLPLEPRPLNWQDIIEAAYSLRADLAISQASWSEACALLGRVGAALCLLITDQGTLREDDPVLKPPAFFNGMINKGRVGELRLHSSIFGLIEREEKQSTALLLPSA